MEQHLFNIEHTPEFAICVFPSRETLGLCRSSIINQSAQAPEFTASALQSLDV